MFETRFIEKLPQERISLCRMCLSNKKQGYQESSPNKESRNCLVTCMGIIEWRDLPDRLKNCFKRVGKIVKNVELVPIVAVNGVKTTGRIFDRYLLNLCLFQIPDF